MSVKIKPFYIFSLSPWWSLPIASFWKYISDIERFHCLSVWNKEKGGVGGFIIRKSIELMKDSLPFNFISLTAALLLPFPEHKQIKGTRVIHLLCYQTVLVLGIAFRPTHTHTHSVTHLFLAFIRRSSNFSSPQGYLLLKLKKWRGKRAGECQLFMNMAERGAKGLAKCTYFLAGWKQWRGGGAGRRMMKIRFWGKNRERDGGITIEDFIIVG